MPRGDIHAATSARRFVNVNETFSRTRNMYQSIVHVSDGTPAPDIKAEFCDKRTRTEP